MDADMDEEIRRPTPEHATEDDPIPEVFPEQDPKVDREWEAAKNDPMGGESPPAEPRWEDGHLLPSADRGLASSSTATPAPGTHPGAAEPPHLTQRDGSFRNR